MDPTTARKEGRPISIKIKTPWFQIEMTLQQQMLFLAVLMLIT